MSQRYSIKTAKKAIAARKIRIGRVVCRLCERVHKWDARNGVHVQLISSNIQIQAERRVFLAFTMTTLTSSVLDTERPQLDSKNTLIVNVWDNSLVSDTLGPRHVSCWKV